ncbi:tRNA pseudouridine(38-40) synthase TruA [Thalassotalea sp. 1_MG-2023]|uniref:tRNA pseudouridine(38-40) synthase TruA n=1 Tax=Thalassotalea sp. 1_MG-2023 TaxID=3062680 RepID=UPI0026E3A1CF|nr:tRNA pseudouridine(38-40) synthase TruA [Thalassotalea sp. 1_MG-2023]MDO6427965.1 tRNA pseudouridine(38-40) synthase TruA [Thalassotalea sp. 1_MG-2023]
MRFALGIEYDGSQYCGWQRQNNVVSVQETLEKALSKIANEPINVICAGRTDTGVSATNQVVHFDTHNVRKEVAWTLGVNTHLPKDIAVTWVKAVDETFHARFGATSRRYRYIIYNNPLRPAIFSTGLTFNHYPLDEKLMHKAAQFLVGEHDFTSFRTVHCQAPSAVRTIEHCQVSRQGNYLCIDVKGNAFLHHMIRNIAGSLMRVGRGQEEVEWIAEVLAAKNRCLAGVTAPANGLYFVDVTYPEKYQLPSSPLGPIFFN